MLHFFIYVCIAILIVACPLMCLVILMQRSKQEGLGAAFGGGITESVWGAQTSNVLVKSTVVLASTFFIVCIVLARLYAMDAHVAGNDKVTSPLQQQLLPSVPMTATNASGAPVVPTATATTPAAANPPATNAAPVPVSAPATTSAPAATSTNAAPKTK